MNIGEDTSGTIINIDGCVVFFLEFGGIQKFCPFQRLGRVHWKQVISRIWFCFWQSEKRPSNKTKSEPGIK
jgi:hypothetical protein